MTAVDDAFRRIDILKKIVARTRKDLENPARRNPRIELGISDEGDTLTESNAKLKSYFNELQILLDFIHVAHMTASFELECGKRLPTIIGKGRALIKDGLDLGSWPIRLLKDFSDLSGLRALFSLLGQGDLAASKVKEDRNLFCHGMDIKSTTTTSITADEVHVLLSCLLQNLDN